MTKKEMDDISREINDIEQRLGILSPDNIIESKQRKILLSRLVFLEHRIDLFLRSEKRNRMRVINP